jgi:hypothetical protein
MCLHVEELPCEGLGRVAHHILSLPALDDLAAQEYTHLLLLVLPHNLGGDG